MKYFTITKAAKFLDCSTRIISDWIYEGKLGTHHPNRKVVLIPAKEIERLLKDSGHYAPFVLESLIPS